MDAAVGRYAAVIGLGSMGMGMARALRRAGFDVVGCDANPATVERFVREGGRGAPDPASAAANVDIVICVVVNAAQTEAVLFGENGVASSMPEGAVFISSATMDPAACRRLAARLESAGRLYLDAPISGGAARAADGTLTVLASARGPAGYCMLLPDAGTRHPSEIYCQTWHHKFGRLSAAWHQTLAANHLDAADDPQHLGRRGLLPQRLGELPRALLLGLELAVILCRPGVIGWRLTKSTISGEAL
jgi:putative dehydrogenase